MDGDQVSDYARGVMARRGVWLVAFIVVASGSAAAGQRAVILPADASGDTARDVLGTVDQALAGLVGPVIGVDIVVGSTLKKKVRLDARSCGEEPACLAKVGRRLKVDEVITVRARTHGHGLRLTFLVVGVENHRLVRTVSVNVDAVDGVEAAVRIRLAKILGVNQAQLYATVETGAGDEFLPLEPMPSLAPLPGADETKTPPAEKPVETVVAEPVAEPDQVSETVPVPQGPTGPPASPGSSWMWYTGLSMVGVAAAVGGVGTYFGARYFSKKNAIDSDGPQTTPQKPAVRLEGEANSARVNGIIFGVAAGVVGAAGVGLLLAELVGGDVDVNVSVQPGGAQAGVVLTW